MKEKKPKNSPIITQVNGATHYYQAENAIETMGRRRLDLMGIMIIIMARTSAREGRECSSLNK
jgi:hypothetical protein